MGTTIRILGLLTALTIALANCGPTQESRYNDVFSKSLSNPKWIEALSSIRKELMDGGSDHSLTGRRFDIGNTDEELPGICEVCEYAVESLLGIYRSGLPSFYIKDAMIGMCETYDLSPPHVCQGMADLNFPIVMYIIRNNPKLTPATVCGTFYQADLCQLDEAGRQLMDWRIQIDESNARPATESKKTIQTAREPLTIVHITDTHTDPLYSVGSLADCDENLCCREGVMGEIRFPNQTAGRWGDYRVCDSPWESTLNVFEQIRENHPKIDLVYFTGDTIDHATWKTSHAANAEAVTRTFDTLKEIFPNVPVLPIIGNHEPHPSNQFSPSTVTDDELESRSMYAMLAANWQKWLPADALTTVLESGYYSTLVRPGLRVIGLNNNDGATINYWLLLDASYVSRQLQWLHDTLLQAERDGEKVHILVHFPNNHYSMHSTYSREYRRIVERFWDTISGQFNGHTHKDQFYVYYDEGTSSKAINVAWNGGSATTFTNVNPNYRVYTVEPETFQIINHQTFIYNLTEANLTPDDKPRWFQEYSFAEDFGISDLSPDSLDSLLTRFSLDEQALHRYWQFKVKMGDPWLVTGCDKNCLATELCSLATTSQTPGIRNRRCEELLDQWFLTTSGK